MKVSKVKIEGEFDLFQIEFLAEIQYPLRHYMVAWSFLETNLSQQLIIDSALVLCPLRCCLFPSINAKCH